MKWTNKYILVIFLFLGIFQNPSCILGQNDELEHVTEGDTRKEEIQRYIGYEKLLYRYLSLPYDSTMNINERGNFVDIGFLYLMFLPLLLLIYFKKENKLLAWCMGILLFLMFILATSNSFVLEAGSEKDPSQSTMNKNVDGKFEKTSQSKDLTFVGKVVKNVYSFNNLLYTPFASLGETISGDKDHVTYPILILLFALTGFLIYRVLAGKENAGLITIAYLFFNYSFFWLVLSSGIVWYGFFMLFLGMIIMLFLLGRIKEREPFHYRWLMPSFAIFASIWVVMALTNRISGISPGIPETHLGKGMFHSIFYLYNSGVMDSDQVLDNTYPTVPEVFERINRDKEALVYRIGTSFTYFVENNHKRVLADNQLGTFNALTNEFSNKEELAEALKKSGFKYMIIDLNTVTIDKTEGKTLTQKFNALMNFIYKNEKIRPLATNRILRITNPETGQQQNIYGIFGKDIVVNGSYAIVELI